MGADGKRHASADLPPGPDWTGVENLATTGIRSSDRPALSSYTGYASPQT